MIIRNDKMNVELDFCHYDWDLCSTEKSAKQVNILQNVSATIYYQKTLQYREIQRKIWSVVIFSDYMEPR